MRTQPIACALLLSWSAPAVAQSIDPVVWELELERAVLRIEHAQENVDQRGKVLAWVRRLPVDEEVGRLALLRNEFLNRDDYQPVRIELDRARLAYVEADAELRRLKLNLEEMELAGRFASDQLFARPVKQRDFVTERREIELEVLQESFTILKPRYDTCRVLVDERAVPWRDLARLANELEAVTSRIGRLEFELSMRQLMLANELPDEAHFMLREDAIEREEALLTSRLERTEEHFKELEPLVGRGFTSHVDLDHARDEMRVLRQRLEELRIDRRILEYELAKFRESQ
ncbi:MAG: hypothetical protein ACYTGC_07525 [Planctomycetota bacterium]|jgi:multidrug resistance efflux pump